MIKDPHKKKNIFVRNKKIPVWTYGDTKNYPIIFIHGYFRGFSDYVGDLPMRYLSKYYCVYAFDLPGFGESKNLSMDTAAFIGQMIAQVIGDRHFAILGSSYGGVVALRYALKLPANLDALIIAGTPYGGKFSLLRFIWLPNWINPVLSRFIHDFKIMNKKNFTKINLPVLLFYGLDDTRATPQMGKELNKTINRSRIIFYKRTHAWLLHRVDESGLLEAIRKLLKPFAKK